MTRFLRLAPLSAALLLALFPGVRAARPVLLGGPEVVKLDWNTRAMVAADIDGDGRLDLALLNNDRARIELLFQDDAAGKAGNRQQRGGTARWTPVLEDARFRRESVTTGLTMYALAAGDLDGNGRTDLAFTTRRGTVTVRYQDRAGEWERRRVFEVSSPAQWTSSIAAEDVDDDGDDDLVVLLENEVAVFLQGRDGIAGAARYPLADDKCYGLLVDDLDGDGKRDLSYLAQRSNRAWRVRFQTSTGQFGPEQAFRLLSPGRGMRPESGETSGPRRLATINPRTGQIERIRLERTPRGEDLLEWQPGLRYFAASTGDDQSSSYAFGDLDGNGLTDVVVGDGPGARVLLHMQESAGAFGEPRPYPSFSAVRSLTAGDLDGDGRDELIVASSEEEVIGVASLSPAGRLEYPSPLPTDGRPLAVAAHDLDGDGRMEIVYARNRDGSREIAWLSRERVDAEWTEQTIVLEGLRTNPDAVKILDANGDGRPDIAVFALQSPVRFVLQSAAGDFREMSGDDGFRRGLVDKVRPSGLVSGDLDGDGRDEMLVTGRGFARALRVDDNDRLTVLDQFNARDSESQIDSVLPLDVDGDGSSELVFLEKGGQTLQLLARDGDGVYRYRRSVPVGRIDVVDAAIRDLDGDRSPDLVFLGKDRFWWVPSGRRDWRPLVEDAHEPAVEEMTYTDLAVGDLDGDGTPEIVAVDAAQSHQLEILGNEAGELAGRLHFTIFEADPHYSGRQGADNEPRQFLVADVTGDGRDDLVLLVHDRILIYPQG